MRGTSTLVTQLANWASQAPDKPALHGGSPSKGFTDYTWGEYESNVRRVGKALIALGVQPGDRVTIIGRNRPEWMFADLGVMAARAVPTPIYATNTPEQVAWLVNHCESRVAIIDDEAQYEKFLAVRDQLPALEKIVIMGDVAGRDKDWTLSWDEFLSLGGSVQDGTINQRINSAQADDLALLCYTSGTTGEPKGVMLTHGNFAALGESISERFISTPLEERVLSYLPLCHVAEHTFSIIRGIQGGYEVYTCDDLNQIKEYLPAVRPTMFLAVPRVWEKFEAALKAKLGEATGVKAVLADWAIATEKSWFDSELAEGAPITGVTRILADRLVLNKVKTALGMQDVHTCISGAAPLNPATADFFASLGLPIAEVYGMTETSAVISFPPPSQTFSGKVGKPLSCVELKIASDGEVIVRGPTMTPGYYKNEEETRRLLDAGSWLHTGDIGEVDEQGFLRITDRKKELFKTSGGKYVAPAPIEAKLKSLPELSQAVLVGDGQKFVGALVAIDPEAVGKLAQQVGIDAADAAELANSDAVVQYLQDRINEEVNSSLARFEQVKRIVVLPAELSPEHGELTPTLKLKRRVITEKHASEIASIYA
ncbi:MAG: long-chain fatty acid--CoA ligase [Actinobacteria bacterium]|nr:long-chain fatty acid--CoA ligase [Actinomycetota bacterium]